MKAFTRHSIAVWSRMLPLTLAALMLSVLFAACGDDLSVTPEESSIDREPILEASVEDVVLTLTEYGQTALTLSWTPGTNHGTNLAVDYALEIDVEGGDFSSPVVVDLGRRVYSKAYAVEELNALLIEEMGVEPASDAALQVRVRSQTADASIPPDYSNIVVFSATPFAPLTPTLYLIGDATPNGWDAGNASEMTADPNRPYVFSFQGNLSPGTFKFITTRGEFLPSYNRGVGADELVYRTDDSQPDEQFEVQEAGPYIVTANLAAMTVSVERMAGPAYEQLWVVGDAVPTGWDLDNAAEMRQDPSDPFLFDYNEVLAAGELKIATAKNWDAPFYRPTENYPDLSNPAVQLSAGDPDHKWYISEPGAYKITLNIRDMTISIEPFTPYEQIWIVGDATPNGWNIDAPNEMQATADPNVFVYEGPLAAGEFKFPLATGDWGADYFMPAVNYQPLDETYVKFIPSGNPDNKWLIENPGNYRLTLNQLYETIVIERL